jgi:DNA modification methylase
MIVKSDCLDWLKHQKENSVDSLVTDPPAGISFMGKEWDGDKGGRKEWVAWLTDVMSECLRVMKPGAHGLIWALPRTSHWTAMALEDAGFEIRDCVYHLFGSGFPKSLDVSKAIDKAAGAEGPIVGKNPAYRAKQLEHNAKGETAMRPMHKRGPATADAKRWQGFGTALKPAVECWWLVRKPLSEKTVAKNVLKWGTGGINVDGCRIEGDMSGHVRKDHTSKSDSVGYGSASWQKKGTPQLGGRFPANLVLSHTPYCSEDQCDIECAIQALDKQSGISSSKAGGKSGKNANPMSWTEENKDRPRGGHTDSGGASRFFYCAKISSSERNAGLEGMTKKVRRSDARPNSGDLTGKFPDHDNRERAGNHHPTVKPQKLMRYLCRMITPPGGTVLDPFMGSGSTGLAALSEGFKFIGVEREAEYHKIAEARIFSHFPEFKKQYGGRK